MSLAPVTLSARAVEKVKETLAQEGTPTGGLRVSVVGGGCSGFQYRLGVHAAAEPDDIIVAQDGVTLFVDPTSLDAIQGTLLDYLDGLHGAGFRFVNPHATRTCGCGSSFSTG